MVEEGLSLFTGFDAVHEVEVCAATKALMLGTDDIVSQFINTEHYA